MVVSCKMNVQLQRSANWVPSRFLVPRAEKSRTDEESRTKKPMLFPTVSFGMSIWVTSGSQTRSLLSGNLQK